jgi:hypothetical protein
MRHVTLGLSRRGRRAQFCELSESDRALRERDFEDRWDDSAPTRDGAPPRRPNLRRRQLGLATILITLCATALSGFGVVVLAAAQSANPSLQAAASTPSQWIDIVRPIEMFSLESPELNGLARLYQARRNGVGGRQDTLGYGNAPGKGVFLRLTAYRPGSEEAAPTSFFVDLVRSAAAAGLSIGHNLQPQESTTRFGLMEIADIDLIEQSGTTIQCLGFRTIERAVPVRLSGFACGARDKPVSRPGLVCLIERFDVTSAGGDQSLARFFATTELKRNAACAGMALAPTPAHSNWLDQADARPPLRLKKTR